MVEFAYAVIIFGFLFLGVRLFLKVRAIASWRPEKSAEMQDASDALPSDLRHLAIEPPKDDLEGHHDGSEGKPDTQD
ncbi:MAG TPA: hypothetical protein VMH23_02380 [Bacteroidota bacterium]|nr:hypothetical protein [Bacteroidota bacterium]